MDLIHKYKTLYFINKKLYKNLISKHLFQLGGNGCGSVIDTKPDIKPDIKPDDMNGSCGGKSYD